MLSIIVKILLAHIIGDFALQPDKWAKDKQENKLKSKYLYLHGLVHLLAFVTVFGFNPKYYAGAVFIGITHLGIDVLKVYSFRKGNAVIMFIADQILHLLIIALVVYCYVPYRINFEVIFSDKSILQLTTFLILTFVVSVLIKVLMAKWENEITQNNSEVQQGKSLKLAGMYIGMLERIFIFLFVILGQWAGIGFLFAAKSIFRFGDLSKGNDRKLTEYILIGTLLSFGLAIAIALLYEKIVVLL